MLNVAVIYEYIASVLSLLLKRSEHRITLDHRPGNRTAAAEALGLDVTRLDATWLAIRRGEFEVRKCR